MILDGVGDGVVLLWLRSQLGGFWPSLFLNDLGKVPQVDRLVEPLP